jgi:hypothetical protein
MYQCLRVAARVAQPESAGRLQAGRPLPAAALRRWPAAVPVPVHFFPEAVPAHFFAEAAVQAQRSAQLGVQRSVAPAVLAGQAVARLPEELAARDAAAVPLRVAGHAGVAPEAAQHAAEEPREAAEPWVAAAAVRQEAVPGAGVVLRPEAAARAEVEEVVLQPAARDVAGVPQPAAPDVRAPARPSAGLLVFHRDRVQGWPVRSPAARFARAMESL